MVWSAVVGDSIKLSINPNGQQPTFTNTFTSGMVKEQEQSKNPSAEYGKGQ